MLENDLFYIDDSQGMRITYEQLWRDVDALQTVPPVLVFEDCYGLFVTLLAAIQRNTELILVDNEQDRAIVESYKATEAQERAPHPRPLSPEYRGEGREVSKGSLSAEYRGEGREDSKERKQEADAQIAGDALHATEAQERAPHPRPLSPEYRGEGREVSGREVSGREASEREASEREVSGREASGREVSGREASGREAPGGEDSEGKACGGEAYGKEASGREDPEGKDLGRESCGRKDPEGTDLERESSGRKNPEGKNPESKTTGRDRCSLAASSCRIGLLTSGTTGKPKLVLHALDSLTRAVRIGEQHRGAVWGLAYHPAHFAGLQVFFQALGNGNTIVRLFGLDSQQMHDAIEQQTITHLSATPTLMRLLASGQHVHAGVKQVTLGGERSDPELIAQLKQLFPQAAFRNVYASTEVGSVLASDGDVFHVPNQYQGLIKIVDGELSVHRSLLATSLQAKCQDDFYLTGDCVEVVEQTPLTFRLVSRRGDFINVGGYKVNPHEVEDEINLLPAVKESYVYGKPNSVTGNLVCCDVVLNVGQQLTTRELIARLTNRLPDYKIPRITRVVSTLPVTSTGKRVRKT